MHVEMRSCCVLCDETGSFFNFLFHYLFVHRRVLEGWEGRGEEGGRGRGGGGGGGDIMPPIKKSIIDIISCG